MSPPGAVSQYRRPESVLVVVCTRAPEVLLLRRVRPPDAWQSVTGSLHWEEDALSAARRELAEETGLHDVPIEDCGRSNRFEILPGWGQARFAPGVTHNQEHVFRAVLPAPAAVTLNPLEHTAAEWVAPAEAAARVFSWSNRDAIRDFVPGA